MLIKLQYLDLGHEEFGLVTTGVNPKKPFLNQLETNFVSLAPIVYLYQSILVYLQRSWS